MPGERAQAIEAAVCDQPWPAMVDPTQLELILLNLAINARDAMPGGGTLRVSTANVALGTPMRPEEPCAGDYVRVAVSDTGKGINPEYLPHVFDRFSQEDYSTTRRYGGLGLGLSIVRHITELHGGTVQAASDGEGRGATFTIRLPLTAGPVAQP